MDKFTKEELDKIILLLDPNDRTNHHLAYSLLRGRMKLSEVKRFAIKLWGEHKFDGSYFKYTRYEGDIIELRRTNLINSILRGSTDWYTGWYGDNIIASLSTFEVFGIKHFLLNGKYKNM